mgnify:FL=1
MAKGDWIQKMLKSKDFHHGAFRREAERAGMSTRAFMNKVLKNPQDYSRRTHDRAVLARTLMRFNKK